MDQRGLIAVYRRLALGACVLCGLAFSVNASAQQLGPTSARSATAGQWPASPPRRIYVLPFYMDPALQAELEQAKSAGVIPRGPVRQLLAERPTVVNMVTGNNPDAPVGGVVAKLVADEMAAAGWPVVFWAQPTPPPPDGWRLGGQVVLADEAVPRPATSWASAWAISMSASMLALPILLTLGVNPSGFSTALTGAE